MHLRVSTVRRGSKVYRYAHLVESYRRPEDGRPTHRVLAALGTLSDEQIAAMRVALEAARGGEPVATSVRPVAIPQRPVVLANYRYLDLAVLLRVWNESGLGALLADLLPERGQDVGADQVLAALVMHRCVAPGSKLSSERWFPDTALPELQGVAPAQFNNSRLHRALESLEAVDAALQARLPHTIQRTQGACVRLFIDATDTWIVGRKLPLAAEGKDKEGIFRRRVGIVLLCDQRGFPLRWTTLSGRYHDGTSLLEMAKEARKLDWVGDLPVVLDRAVGNAAAVETLDGTGLRYLTALPWIEFVSSGAPIPWKEVEALQAACLAEGASAASVAAAGAAHGFSQPRPDRLLRDLGVFSKAPALDSDRGSTAVKAMRFALELQGLKGRALAEAAKRHRNTAQSGRRHQVLLQLDPQLQLRVLAGQADSLGVVELRELAILPREAQVSAFEAAIARTPARRVRAKSTAPSTTTVTLPVRGVLYFNPERFSQTRRTDIEARARVEAAVADINRRLASRQNRRSDAGALAEAHKAIVQGKLGQVLAPRMERSGELRTVVLDEDEGAWARRRQADGLSLLVGHQALVGTPDELVKLYFEKDVVEKDFHTIKSTIELRPIHHRTDVKLRAHVTICMLALLLQRILAQRLARTAKGVSAVAALETLAPVHLNHIASGKTNLYTVTQLSDAQNGILAALGMEDLARDDKAAAVITPR